MSTAYAQETAQAEAATDTVDSHAVLTKVIAQTHADRWRTERALEALRFVEEKPLDQADFELDAFLDTTIPILKAARDLQLDEFLQHPKLAEPIGKRELIERMVCDPTRDESLCQVYVLPAKKAQVVADIRNRGFVIDETELYRMLVRDRYGVAGGSPLLLCSTDFEIGPGADDLKFADALARLGARAHMPFLTQASPKFFKADGWAELPRSKSELEKRWKSKDNEGYRDFRKEPHSRYLSLAMLDLAVRQPFGRGVTAEGLDDYVETVSDPGRLTTAPVTLAIARLVSRSLSMHNWPGCLAGVKWGGLIDGLYSYDYLDAVGDESSTCPTSFSIDDLIEMFFHDTCSFIAPVHIRNTNKAVIYATPTVQSLVRGDPATLADAKDGAKLPNLLVQGRFAHLLKVIMRELIGSAMDAGKIESFLQRWADQYCSEDDGASERDKALYPFKRIKISVNPVPGCPGILEARVDLVPRFRVAGIATSLYITSDDLTPPVADSGS